MTAKTEEPSTETAATESPTELAIQCRDLHVRYQVFAEGATSVGRRFRTGGARNAIEVHAVRGIHLDVQAGESLGVIGNNGSGKSSLLGAIAGTLTASQGTVRVRSQPSLLGVGAALNRQLSGSRNILLGGLALGLSHDEVLERQPAIEAFADLGDAIERPLGTYSKGMRARLAFSIATLQNPDILLIDEALAVGDREFRRKSLKRIRELQRTAGTILLVSHNLTEVQQACTRTIWLDRGQIKMDGPTNDVLEIYQAEDW